MSDVESIDAFLFSLCCERKYATVQHAADALRKRLEIPSEAKNNGITVEVIAAASVINYQNLTLPTPRQHILRMAQMFSPEQLEAMAEKLDGCSEAKQLEVLSSLQRRYGLVVGNDIAVTVDPMQCLLLRNRALVDENVMLRQQLQSQKPISDLADAHQEVLDRLYDCVAALESVRAENMKLKRFVHELEEEIVGLKNLKSSHGHAEQSKGTGEAREWIERCDALQGQMEKLISAQILEREQLGKEKQLLRIEADRSRQQVIEQTTRANLLAQQLAEHQASSAAIAQGMRQVERLFSKDAASQTAWAGSAGFPPTDTADECKRARCVENQKRVLALTSRLSAATAMIQKC